MKTATVEVLDRVADKLGHASDYRVAKELGVSRQAVSNWRGEKNYMADGAALRAASILGEKPEVLLALLGAERTQDPDARKVWTNLARRLQRSAATGTIAALGFLAFFGSQALHAGAVLRQVCILC
jgi:plasmid maintenance system antidote protein VapI